MCMRWTVCLLTILLSGCHGVLLLERPTVEASPSIMPLWERYQQCLVSTDPTEMLLIIEQFERVMPAGVPRLFHHRRLLCDAPRGSCPRRRRRCCRLHLQADSRSPETPRRPRLRRRQTRRQARRGHPRRCKGRPAQIRPPRRFLPDRRAAEAPEGRELISGSARPATETD